MRQETLEGGVAVVTGGTRGIGNFIARGLNDAGMVVAITGRQEKSVRAAAAAISSHCRGYVCDQRDPDAVETLAQEIQRDLGAPQVLVANAGVVRMAPVMELPLAAWNEVIETNLTGTFLTVQAFLPGMLARQHGDIFLMGSTSGKKGDPSYAAYAASKFGIQGFADALRYEVRTANVRVTVLNPSRVDVATDTGPLHGRGLTLHAADLAAAVVQLARMPGRTMVRELEIWGTNPA